MERFARYLLIAIIALLFSSCKTKQNVEISSPVKHQEIGEHSPSVLIIMYDKEKGREPLLKAIKKYKAEIVYDYKIITGMAIRKPADKSLEETIAYFRKVDGVLSVDYDRMHRLTDPVKPKLETF